MECQAKCSESGERRVMATFPLAKCSEWSIKLEVMEKEPHPTGDFLAHPTFSPDLAPMYALTEQQYQMIINNLANLVVALIEELQQAGNAHLALLIAEHAHTILLDYDDDIADYVRFLLNQE